MNLISLKLSKNIIYLCLLLLYGFTQGQTSIQKDNNQIFKGRVKGIPNYGKPNQKFIKDFSVGIKWSVYLGEPVESYAFKWNASNSFTVKVNGQNKTFTKSQINEFPDLAAELSKVIPDYVEVIVYGEASGKSVSVKRGSNPKYSEFYANNLPTYKKNGQSYDRYSLLTHVLYKIGNQHFLFGKSGIEVSGAIIGTSAWKQRTSNYSEPNIRFDYLVRNLSEEKFKKLSKDKKDEANKKFKTAYLNANTLKLKAEIVKIEWGYQLINIANKYLKYKKEGKKKEKKKDDFWEDDEKTKTKKKDDFWEEDSTTKKDKNDDFWNEDRLKVDVQRPINNSVSAKNVVAFEAEYNVFSNAFKGYLEYNGINQRVTPVNGKFRGKMVLKAGINEVTFKIKSSDNTIFSKKFKVTYSGKPVKLRTTLVWDGYADIDLYLKDAKGDVCSYGNKKTSLAVLDVDNTKAYGPENISVEKIISGEYKIYIQNFSKKSGAKATVYIFLDEKLHTTKTHTFNGYNHTKTISTLKL